jgi:hypothetical protein
MSDGIKSSMSTLVRETQSEGGQCVNGTSMHNCQLLRNSHFLSVTRVH